MPRSRPFLQARVQGCAPTAWTWNLIRRLGQGSAQVSSSHSSPHPSYPRIALGCTKNAPGWLKNALGWPKRSSLPTVHWGGPKMPIRETEKTPQPPWGVSVRTGTRSEYLEKTAMACNAMVLRSIERSDCAFSLNSGGSIDGHMRRPIAGPTDFTTPQHSVHMTQQMQIATCRIRQHSFEPPRGRMSQIRMRLHDDLLRARESVLSCINQSRRFGCGGSQWGGGTADPGLGEGEI